VPYLVSRFSNETEAIYNNSEALAGLVTAYTLGSAGPDINNEITISVNIWVKDQTMLAYDMAKDVAKAAAIVTFVLLVANWIFLFRQFKRKLLQYRRGFYVEKPEKRIQYSTHYFGFQIVCIIISMIMLYFMLSIIFYVIAFAVYSSEIAFFLVNLVVPTLTAYLIIALPISLIESYIITKKDGKEIKTNFLFYLADCLFLALHLLRGLVLMPIRALLATLLLSLYFARLDVYMFPAELRPYDWGSSSFNSMVYLEHKYNNPIALVFREALKKEINHHKGMTPEKQAKRNLQIKFQQAILLSKNEPLRRLCKAHVNSIKKEKIEFIKRAKEEISIKCKTSDD